MSDTRARLQRTLTLVTALEQLLERELARTAPRRPGWPEDVFSAPSPSADRTGGVQLRALLADLEVERLSLIEELGVEECSIPQAEQEANFETAAS
jgi:hypothetical protein